MRKGFLAACHLDKIQDAEVVGGLGVGRGLLQTLTQFLVLLFQFCNTVAQTLLLLVAVVKFLGGVGVSSLFIAGFVLGSIFFGANLCDDTILHHNGRAIGHQPLAVGRGNVTNLRLAVLSFDADSVAVGGVQIHALHFIVLEIFQRLQAEFCKDAVEDTCLDTHFFFVFLHNMLIVFGCLACAHRRHNLADESEFHCAGWVNELVFVHECLHLLAAASATLDVQINHPLLLASQVVGGFLQVVCRHHLAQRVTTHPRIMDAEVRVFVGTASFLWRGHQNNRCHACAVALCRGGNLFARSTQAVVDCPALGDASAVAMQANVNLVVIFGDGLAKGVNVGKRHTLHVAPKACNGFLLLAFDV